MTSFGEPLKGGGFLSDRLLAVLRTEMAALERGLRRATGSRSKGGAQAAEGAEVSAATAKGRVETISQMTRTLEKLLELRRLEDLAARGEDEGTSAETLRLRDEMMRRLRALDARRIAGAALFGEEGQGPFARLAGAVA